MDSQEVNFQTAEVGKEVEAKGVSATLDKVYLSDHTFTEDEQELGLVFFQLTIHNNTDQDLATSFLSNSFAILADGEGYPGIDIRSNRFVMLQFGEDAESFNDPIPAGESRQGYGSRAAGGLLHGDIPLLPRCRSDRPVPVLHL